MGRVPAGNTTSGFYEAAVTKAGTSTRVSPKYHESTTSQRGGAARTMAMGSQGTEEEEDDVDDDTDTEDEQEGETDVKRDCLGEADGHEAYFMTESAPVRRPRNPAEPTKLEVEQHWATHLPYRPWSPYVARPGVVKTRILTKEKEANKWRRPDHSERFDGLCRDRRRGHGRSNKEVARRKGSRHRASL